MKSALILQANDVNSSSLSKIVVEIENRNFNDFLGALSTE